MTQHKKMEEMLEKLQGKIEQLEKKLDSIEGQKKIEYTFNIEKVDVHEPVLEELSFHLDKLDIKELSGALNMGNNFGTKVEPKKKPKQKEKKQKEDIPMPPEFKEEVVVDHEKKSGITVVDVHDDEEEKMDIKRPDVVKQKERRETQNQINKEERNEIEKFEGKRIESQGKAKKHPIKRDASKEKMKRGFSIKMIQEED